MTRPSLEPASSRRRFPHILAFVVVLSLWTWKLLEPYPIPEEISEGLAKLGLQFAAAKSLHVVGYAFLTILAITVPLPTHWRYFLVGLLALHGVATEIGQRFVPNRTGSVRDVLFDWCGVALGLLLVRVWNRPRHSPKVPPSP